MAVFGDTAEPGSAQAEDPEDELDDLLEGYVGDQAARASGTADQRFEDAAAALRADREIKKLSSELRATTFWEFRIQYMRVLATEVLGADSCTPYP